MKRILFVSEYSQRGTRWVLNGSRDLNKDANLIFIDIGLDEPDIRAKEFIEKFEKEHDNINVIDTQDLDMNGEDFRKFVISKINKYSCECVCFINCEEIYNILKNDVEKKYVAIHERTLKAAKTAALKRLKESSSNNIDACAKAKSNIVNNLHNAQDVKKIQDVHKEQKESEQKEPNTKTEPDTRREPHSKKDNNEDIYKNIANNIKVNNENKEEKKPSTSQPPAIETKKDALRELESKIFVDKSGNSEVKHSYTRLEITKTDYIEALYDNLTSAIKTYVAGNLDDEFFLDFIKLIIKTDTYNDFEECFKVTWKGTIRFNIDEPVFLILKKKVLHYSQICDLLFND